MAQPVQYGLRFPGPFLGLNSDQARHKVGPAFATKAEDVLITRTGSVRPREPLSAYIHSGDHRIPGVIQGMIHVDLQTLSGVEYEFPTADKAAVLVKAVKPGERIFRLITRQGQSELSMAGHTAATLSLFPPTWVFAGGWLYIIDGSLPLVKYNGVEMRTVGILPPIAGKSTGDEGHVYPEDVLTGIPVWPSIALVRYAVTFYDSECQTESNPIYFPDLDDPGALIGPNVTVRLHYRGIDADPNPLPSGRGIDTIRIYRQNMLRPNDNRSLGQTFYRLVAELDAGASAQDDESWTDTIQVAESGDEQTEDVTLSDTITGPFAPSRNGVPPAARIGAWYKNRMWYSDPDDGSRVWFSQEGKPEHVAGLDAYPANVVRIGGDPDDVITGMVEMAGQLVVLKKGSIWVISGYMEWQTNLDTALGAVTAQVPPEIYKAKCKVGCDATAGGNGAIVCGHPPLLYYPHADGFYVFDGVDDRPVSDLVSKEWTALLTGHAEQGAFARPQNHAIAYAHDTANQILLIAAPPAAMAWFSDRVLCYHWNARRPDGIGAWTQFFFGDQLGIEDDAPLGVCCVATALGKPSYGTTDEGVVLMTALCPYLIALAYTSASDGLTYSRIFLADVDPISPGLDMPDWKWETGDLRVVGGKRAHVYWWETEHDRFLGEENTPQLRTEYSVDGRDFTPVGGVGGTDVSSALTRRRLGRTARSMALRFRRGHPATTWAPWEGITGYALDVELAERR